MNRGPLQAYRERQWSAQVDSLEHLLLPLQRRCSCRALFAPQDIEGTKNYQVLLAG